MLITIPKDNKTNSFSGDEIESLEMEQSILADHWTLTLKNGSVLKIKPDWRGQECYLSLYEEEVS